MGAWVLDCSGGQQMALPHVRLGPVGRFLASESTGLGRWAKCRDSLATMEKLTKQNESEVHIVSLDLTLSMKYT